jgi:dTDP-4-amino-4,6-dideoxygalactose transaminase
MRVPFFNYPFLFKSQETELTEIILRVCRSGAFIMQQDLVDFEKNLAKFTGAKHAFGVADGTEAISISLMAAGVKPGDEVIMPSHTFVATAGATNFVGAKPVLADCGRDHMLDPEAIEPLITDKTTCIMPVQLNGRTCDMDAIGSIAKKHGLKIVEDSAQALGSKFKGQSAGTFGSAGTFSFYPAKILGCFGDGGGVVTNDDSVAERVELLRDHGRSKDGEIVAWGLNSRLDNLQAAILNFKLKHLDADLERRRTIAAKYQERLGNVAQLLLPPPPESDKHFDVYQNYEIEADKRNELQSFLKDNEVGTLVQWSGKAVHQWQGLGFKEKPKYTEDMFKKCLMLPMNVSLSDDDVDYVCDKVIEFYGK